ncbi:MAG: hypothetical protein HYV28_07970 [Ignavibacteriales bacterium]|nr:hypothetical protein [Ignavibacteriales bacterium]
MICSHCGKQLEIGFVTYKNLNFCNNLCRYMWQKSETHIGDGFAGDAPNQSKGLIDNSDFILNIPQLPGKKVQIRASYFFGCRLYIDDKKVKPAKRIFLKRKKQYIIPTEFSEHLVIVFRRRLIDPIPSIFVQGREVQIARKLLWYDYILLALSLPLLFLGLLGGIIGGASLFTNAIILRKIRPPFIRYGLSILNVSLAVYFFFQVWFSLLPYTAPFLHSMQSTQAKHLSADSPKHVTSHIWILQKVVNPDNGQIINAPTLVPEMRFYFLEGGLLYEEYPNGNTASEQWKFDDSSKTITFQSAEAIATFKITKITKNELVLTSTGIETQFTSL